jgi:hypothetical protein
MQKYDAGMQGDVSSITTAKFARIIRDQRPIVSFNDRQKLPVPSIQQTEVPHRHLGITAGASCCYQIG